MCFDAFGQIGSLCPASPLIYVYIYMYMYKYIYMCVYRYIHAHKYLPVCSEGYLSFAAIHNPFLIYCYCCIDTHISNIYSKFQVHWIQSLFLVDTRCRILLCWEVFFYYNRCTIIIEKLLNNVCDNSDLLKIGITGNKSIRI